MSECHEATGLVVVIDVLRAFTTTAYAFAQGAESMSLVSTVEQAFALRRQYPNRLLAGEVDGLPIDGFDLPNSPSAVSDLDLTSSRLILRTTAGTQGIVRAARASHLFAASLCVATATVDRIRAIEPESVTFVETGVRSTGGGEEDVACADFMTKMLERECIDVARVKESVVASRAAAKFLNSDNVDLPAADLECALNIDAFCFAMQVERVGEELVLRAVPRVKHDR